MTQQCNRIFSCLFIGFLFLTVCACQESKFEQISFSRYEHVSTVDSSEGVLTRSSHVYIVENYRDDVQTLLGIYDFVMHLTDSLPPSDVHGTYTVSFYRESEKTNLEHLAKQPRDFDRHSFSHDLRYIFSWRLGRFSRLEKFRDGEMVYPPDNGEVILSEPPPLKE